MLDNERRACLGLAALEAAACQTGVHEDEAAVTAVIDVLADVAHACDRLGLDPDDVFACALRSYQGDFSARPRAKATLDAEASLTELKQL